MDNFRLSPIDSHYTDQVNWYLREYVGCKHSHDGGRNWAFTSDADPGYIWLPHISFSFDALTITVKPSQGEVKAKEYSDENAYDTISKALDIYGMAEMGIGVSEVALPLLMEAGMIVTGVLAGIVAPAVAVGAGHDAALKKTSREFFFTGFCSTFVMAADGWSADSVREAYPAMQNLPLNSVYPEKRGSFRALYNFGLKAGLLQASRMNTVGVRNLFVLLRKQLKDSELAEYDGEVKSWSPRKRKDYYDRLSSILKGMLLKKNLVVKLH